GVDRQTEHKHPRRHPVGGARQPDRPADAAFRPKVDHRRNEMNMQIDISERGNTTIVAPEGPRLDAEVAADFRAALLELVEGGKGNLVVNLNGVDFIDSSGLGALV